MEVFHKAILQLYCEETE